MTDDFVNGGANRFREFAIVQRGRIGVAVDTRLVNDFIDLVRGNSRPDM